MSYKGHGIVKSHDFPCTEGTQHINVEEEPSFKYIYVFYLGLLLLGVDS